MSGTGPFASGGRLEITGPSDLIEELRAALEAKADRDFGFSSAKEPGIGGTDILKLILDITEVSVQLVAIYLAGRHVARESVRIKKAGKTIDVAKVVDQEAIEDKLKD